MIKKYNFEFSKNIEDYVLDTDIVELICNDIVSILNELKSDISEFLGVNVLDFTIRKSKTDYTVVLKLSEDETKNPEICYVQKPKCDNRVLIHLYYNKTSFLTHISDLGNDMYKHFVMIEFLSKIKINFLNQ